MKQHELEKLKNREGPVWEFLNEDETNPLFYMVDEGCNEHINYKVAATYNRKEAWLATMGVLDSFNKLIEMMNSYGIKIESMVDNEYYEELIDMWVSLPDALKDYALNEKRLELHLMQVSEEIRWDVQWYLYKIIAELNEILSSKMDNNEYKKF